MYASIHRYRRTAGGPGPEPAAALVAALPGTPGGVCILEAMDGPDGTVIALWPSPETAEAAARQGGGRSYRLADEFHGRAAEEQPTVAQLTWLNGEGSSQRAAAAERGGRERIVPAIRDIDGVVGSYVLRAEDHSLVVLGLSTSIETLDEVSRVITSTELLPGEDPALLPGPDRMELARVVSADLPAGVRS